MSGRSDAASDTPGAPGCALCGKPRQARFSPFCSRRCADLDLGRWLKGGYAIPGSPEEAETPDGAAGRAGGQAPEEE